jgi:putative PIN family toxin of toxin-antitoxin system
MKIVLDANVVIAAFAARGLCESIFELCLHRHQILLSKGLLEEIRQNLKRKIKLPQDIVDEISKLLVDHASMLEPAVLPSDICRDPNDVQVLGLAVSGQADFIVTGDQDLLVLKEFRGVSILTPRSFSAMLHKKLSDIHH